MIGELHGHGQTIVLTTHYMEEADQLCDRVAIIDHGKLLALDTPAALKRSIGTESEVRMHASGDLDALAKVLARCPAWRTRTSSTTRSSCISRPAARTCRDIIATAEQNGFAVTDVGVKETTLETVFINLTGRELRE